MRCEKCGERLYPNDKFCRECGKTVSSEEEEDGELQPMDMKPSRKFNESRSPPPPPGRTPPGEYGCPTCGNTLRYMRQYGRYWCERCQKYAPAPGDVQPASGDAKAAFGVAAIFSFLGGLMLLFLNFGGWWYYNVSQTTDTGRYGTFYYYNTASGGEIINLFSEPEYGALIIPVALAMFICGLTALRGFRGRKPVTKKRLKLAMALSFAAFLIAVIAAAVMFIEVDNANVWLGPGFYGASIGGLVSFIALMIASKKMK